VLVFGVVDAPMASVYETQGQPYNGPMSRERWRAKVMSRVEGRTVEV
jgi:hypothetical protein